MELTLRRFAGRFTALRNKNPAEGSNRLWPRSQKLPLPQRWTQLRKVDSCWQTYPNPFLTRPKQSLEPLMFVDDLCHEHSGHVGDYLVESSDGTCRVAPREIFEDIYV